MDKKIFEQIKNGEISTVEVINDILKKTEEKPTITKPYVCLK